MAKQPDELTAHPVAALFPMLPDDELQELAESIKARGLEHPIVLDSEGRILDGRNRYAACRLAGVEPRFVTYEGDKSSAEDFAFDTNFYRRDMSKGAKAMVFAMRYPDPAKTKRKGSGSLKNKELNEGHVSMARLVLRVTPTVALAVRDGEKPLASAYEEAKVIEAERAEFNRKLDRLKATAQDLALRVTDENMDVDEAIAALNLRETKAREDAERAKSEAERKAAEEAEEKRQARWCATNNLLDALTVLAIPVSHAEDLVAHFDADTAAMRKEKVNQERLDAAAATMKAIADAWRRKEQAVFSEAAE